MEIVIRSLRFGVSSFNVPRARFGIWCFIIEICLEFVIWNFICWVVFRLGGLEKNFKITYRKK